MVQAYKWLPVVSQNSCTGCGQCVAACDHGCLELVWSFATLQRPADCGSEGTCMEACPEESIRMQWVPAEGAETNGRWQYLDEAQPAAPSRGGGWLGRVLSPWSRVAKPGG